MKTTAIKIGIVLAMASSGVVSAAPPVAELQVAGILKTPGCIIQAGDNDDGTYDYGAISPTLIATGTGSTPLDAKAQTWTVSCDAPTFLTLKATDQRKPTRSAAGNTKFGLGSVNEEGKLGYYFIGMRNAKVDGNDTYVFSTTATSFYVYPSVDLVDSAEENYTHGWATATSTLASGRNFEAVFEVRPTLAGTTSMNGPIVDDTHLDGLATLTFQFGIN